MSLISLRQLLDHAAEQNYAVPAFNIQTLEQIIAIMKAANKTNSPVILQISTKTEKYLTSTFIRYLIKATIEKYSKIPICIHYDHARSIKVCKEAIKLGCSSIMMDGSLQSNGITPSNIKYNIEVTQHAVNLAHNEGISVEGEIGCLGAINQSSEKSNVINALSNKIFLTQPKEALMFVHLQRTQGLATWAKTLPARSYQVPIFPSNRMASLYITLKSYIPKSRPSLWVSPELRKKFLKKNL